MRIRKAAAMAVLGTAVAVGTLTVPAQATPAKAPTTAAGMWINVGQYFFRADCETARLYYILRDTPSRCLFNGVFRDYTLQILI
jgi:hypothetical protein